MRSRARGVVSGCCRRSARWSGSRIVLAEWVMGQSQRQDTRRHPTLHIARWTLVVGVVAALGLIAWVAFRPPKPPISRPPPPVTAPTPNKPDVPPPVPSPTPKLVPGGKLSHP